MYKLLINTYLLQVYRFIRNLLKKYGFYTFVGIVTVIALLFSMSIILQNMLMEMLNLILSEGDALMKVRLFRTLIFSVHCCVLIVYFIAVLLGMNRKSQYERMLQNYGVNINTRNILFSIMRCLVLAFVSFLLSIALLGMSFNLIDEKTLLIFGLSIQVIVSIFFLELIYSTILLLFSAFNETILRTIFILLTCGYSYYAYKNNEIWQLTSFVIEPLKTSYLILIVSFFIYFWVMSFDYRDKENEGISSRGRLIPSTLSGKVMKEMLRHKEAYLNTNLMIIICIIITIYKPELFYDPTMCSLMIMMTTMQAIYAYSYFDSVEHLLKRQSCIFVYLSHLLGVFFIVILHLLILILINKELKSGINFFLITSSIFFMFIGKVFPLSKRKSFNSTIIIVLIMLALLPAMILGMEINKRMNFSNLELLILQVISIVLMMGGTYRSLHRSLRR